MYFALVSLLGAIVAAKECVDKKGFELKDRSCGDWKGYDCYKSGANPDKGYDEYENEPFSDSELEMVQENCCESCSSSFLVDSAWKGTYTCTQGVTGIVVHLLQNGVGFFNFHPVEDSNHKCDGSFKGVWRWDNAKSTLTFEAKENGWVKNPCNYITVGFSGKIDDGKMKFSGTIDNWRCGQINMELEENFPEGANFSGEITCGGNSHEVWFSMFDENEAELIVNPGDKECAARAMGNWSVDKSKRHVEFTKVDWARNPCDYKAPEGFKGEIDEHHLKMDVTPLPTGRGCQSFTMEYLEVIPKDEMEYDGCQDDPDFRDEEGYECSEWESYDCRTAVSVWQYSEEGQAALLRNCCGTCMGCRNTCETARDGFCDDGGMKSLVKTCPLGSDCADCGHRETEVCADTPGWVGAKDWPCADWRGYDCEMAVEDWGYTEEQEEELKSNCCETCFRCEDKEGFLDARNYSCNGWVGYSCNAYMGYSEEDMRAVRKNCCATCSTHCVEDETYEDEQGYKCADWDGYDCRTAADWWNYSQEGEDELVEKCCATCAEFWNKGKCVDDVRFKDAQDYTCGDWTGYDCMKIEEEWDYAEEDAKAVRDACCKTCSAFSGCVDDKEYTDAKGYGCSDWVGYNCDNAVSVWDYQEAEMKEIKEKCCATCTQGEQKDDSEDSDSPDSDDKPLTKQTYQDLCSMVKADQTACESYGCKYKAKKKNKSSCKVPSKVKCKKVTDGPVCERLGCTYKKGKCKGDPNF